MPWSHENQENKIVCSKSKKEFDYSANYFNSCRDCWRECVIFTDERNRVVHSYNMINLEG